MSFFDSAIADDAVFAFTDSDGFGAEQVVYVKTSGATRTIYAQILRQPPVVFDANYKQPACEVLVANSVTKGIAASEIDYGGDSLQLADRLGGSVRTLKIFRPADGQPDQDAGMLRLHLG